MKDITRILCIGCSLKEDLKDIEVIDVKNAEEAIDHLSDISVLMIDGNYQLKKEVAEELNEKLMKVRIPIIIYEGDEGFDASLKGLNYISIIHKADSSDDMMMMIRNISKFSSVCSYNDSELMELFLEYNTSYVFFKDENARVIKLSKNYIDMLGIPVEEAIGKNMMEIFPSELAKSMVKDDLKILDEGKVIEVVEELNGHYYKTSKFPIHREGKKSILAGFTIDITDLKITEKELIKTKEEIEQLTITDELLKILNRRGFMKSLASEIERVRRSGNTSVLIIIDIDKFKKINDTLGHFKADFFLKDFVIKVKEHIRFNDLFGRVGGDEFGIVCEGTNSKQAVDILDRSMESIRKHPVEIDGEEYNYSFSAGIVEIKENNLDLVELLHKADQALYEAKNSGRDQYKIYRNEKRIKENFK